MKKTSSSVITLWIIGYFILLLGILSIIYGFAKPCETITCQVENVIWQSTGFLTAFIGSVLIVTGYAKKAKAAEKAFFDLMDSNK
jgi:hypothetical protein